MVWVWSTSDNLTTDSGPATDCHACTAATAVTPPLCHCDCNVGMGNTEQLFLSQICSRCVSFVSYILSFFLDFNVKQNKIYWTFSSGIWIGSYNYREFSSKNKPQVQWTSDEMIIEFPKNQNAKRKVRISYKDIILFQVESFSGILVLSHCWDVSQADKCHKSQAGDVKPRQLGHEGVSLVLTSR
jgi:hypothetical protein